jgi:predicted ATPase/class 3 adenylate cyclase
MGRDLLRGTVTFVFTDIEGSTRLLHDLGQQRYSQALMSHREALRAAVALHDGVEVGTEGDSFFLVFPTASQALDAVSAGLRALRGSGVEIRVGVHTGTADLTAEGYVGMDVHRASRIAGAAHGGQVLVSGATAALVNPERFEFRDLGNHRLKDLPRPERIFQLGAGMFPPIRSLSPSNLPPPTTAFLGRREELQGVKALLADPSVRLLTVTGPGGIGKTRLALEAARESAGSFPDGRWWVALGPLSDGRFVLPTLAAAIASEEPRELAVEELVARLGPATLVLLDNAEHLLPALSGELAGLIAGAEGVTFLVTSRAPLHLEAEREYELRPMNAEDAASYFLSKARAAGTELKPSPTLTRLCERLDRLPLAMQLVAPRVKVFSIEELIDALSRVLDLEGQLDTDPRHRTLRATISWSYSLLAPAERAAFRRLSVFAGSATAEAVEDVTGTDFSALFELVDRSLVRRRDGAGGSRFSMLETIREFAWERLQEAAETEEMLREHARHYRSMAVRAGLAFDGRRGDWVQVLDEELDNVRRSVSWFLERGDHEAAQEVAGSLVVYWLDRGLLSEARSWLERSLEDDGPRGRARVWAANALSSVVYLQGDYVLAGTLANEALADARSLGEPAAISQGLLKLAAALEAEGALEEASTLEEEAVEIARTLRDERPRRLLVALINFGYTDLARGRFEDAARRCEEAMSLAEELGETADAAAARCNMAIASFELGQIDEAGRLAGEAMASAIGVSDRLLATSCLEVLAAAKLERADPLSAATLLGTGEAVRGVMGHELEPVERDLHERTLARLRTMLDGPTIERKRAVGAGLDLEDAFELISHPAAADSPGAATPGRG